MSGDRPPLLFVDVDGVISLFGFDPDGPPPGRFHLIEGVAHCLCERAGSHLSRLAESFELVWATGWEEKADEYLPALVGAPSGLAHLSFDGRARFGSAHWKLDAIAERAAGRPLAWIDDCLDEECHAWAAARSEPTLLVPTEPHRGLEDAQVDAMVDWAARGYTVLS